MAKSDNLRKTKETTATIMEGVTSLEKSMFFNYPSLTTVNLPDSLTTISETAFMSCGSLTRYEEFFHTVFPHLCSHPLMLRDFPLEMSESRIQIILQILYLQNLSLIA